MFIPDAIAAATREEPMPKPNYSFAKRQREMAKKQKKEEKMRQRAAEKAPPADTAPPSDTVPPQPDSAS